MKKEHKNVQMVKAETVVATDYICDICKKRIYTDRRGWFTPSGQLIEYYNIVSGHNDWGNDSVESRESSIVCKECLTTALMQYKNGAERTPYNSCYIEIEHKYSYDGGEYKEEENEYL